MLTLGPNMFKYLYEATYNGQYCTSIISMVIKVFLIHTTCMNGEADYCHIVSVYAYMHLDLLKNQH